MAAKVYMHGRFVADPEQRATNSGTAMVKFTIATERFSGTEKKTDFVNCIAFGKTAETIARFMKKGSECVICGTLTVDPYTDKNGNKRTLTTVIAESFEFCGNAKSMNNGTQYQQPQRNNAVNGIVNNATANGVQVQSYEELFG